jgi:SAM-dependent methyltransferase
MRHRPALAHLAQRGVKLSGVDLSPRMVALASAKWAPLGVRIEQAEIFDWLTADGGRYDAVYSILGAAWFTGPSHLFPHAHKRLVPGGVFVFCQPPAIPGAYGPQGMYKGGFAGKAMFTYRYSYKPAVWERHLLQAGSTLSVTVGRRTVHRLCSYADAPYALVCWLWGTSGTGGLA